MKKYVILTCGVFGIGGGQLYVANKATYLAERGYQVYTFSASSLSKNGKIYYNGLNNARNLICTELQFLPEAYTAHKAERIVNNVIKQISITSSDEIILESNNVVLAAWAELLAAKVGAKHFLFSVGEHNQVDRYTCSFLEFKFNRGEFATINANTFEQLFDVSKVITRQNCPTLRAYLGDNISDYSDPRLQSIETSDYNICIIGRGDKSYVNYSALAVADFCKRHKDVSFTIAIVSEFREKDRESVIRARFLEAPNAKLYILGYFSPFPKEMFKIFDLYIGGAGCASLPYRQNALTLAMDMQCNRPLGFMGYDVEKSLDSATSDRDMMACLEDAAFTKQYATKEYVPAITASAEDVFAIHDAFLAASSSQKDYYVGLTKNVGVKEKIKARMPIVHKLYEAVMRITHGKQKSIR